MEMDKHYVFKDVGKDISLRMEQGYRSAITTRWERDRRDRSLVGRTGNNAADWKRNSQKLRYVFQTLERLISGGGKGYYAAHGQGYPVYGDISSRMERDISLEVGKDLFSADEEGFYGNGDKSCKRERDILFVALEVGWDIYRQKRKDFAETEIYLAEGKGIYIIQYVYLK